MADQPYGLLAEFDSPEALLEAARAARDAGYRRLDAFHAVSGRGARPAIAHSAAEHLVGRD